MKSKFLAGILAIFLGGIGMHLFYLNRPAKGWLYLIFFWTMLPAIFGIIGGLGLLTMSDKEFDRQFNY